MKLFTYGTLMKDTFLSELLDAKFQSKPYTLKNYARFALLNRPYPGLIYKHGASTTGQLYSGLEACDFKILDQYEGDEYKRIMVAPEIQAFIYTASQANILDSEWIDPT